MNRKRFLFPCILLIALMATACTGSESAAAPASATSEAVEMATATVTLPPAPAPTDVPVTPLTIWLSWEPHELQGLLTLIDEFNEEFPTVSFSLRFAPEDDLLAVFLDAQAETPHPALLLGPSSWGPELQAAAVVLPLNDLVDAELLAGVSELGWAQVQVGDDIVGLPFELQGMLLYRNMGLTSAPAGTLSAWVDSAEAIAGEGILGSALDFTFDTTVSQLAACGMPLFPETGLYGFSGENGICWLDVLYEMRQTGQVYFGSNEDDALFLEGNAGWWIGSSNEIHNLVGGSGIDVTVDAWPTYEATGDALAGFVWSENIYFSMEQNPDSLQAAWNFGRFLLSAESQRLLSDPAGAAHITVLSALDLGDPLMAAATSAIHSGVAYPLRADLDVFRRPLEEVVFDVLLQGRDPAAALAAAEDTIAFSFSILAVGGELPEEEGSEP